MRQYKDSGIEWVGKIPETWEVCRFKNMHEKSNVGESIDKEYCTDNSSDTLFYTAGLKPIYTTYDDFPAWKYVNSSDLLLARNGTPYVHLPLAGAVYSDHIIRTSIRKNINKVFIRYCLQQAIASVAVDTVSIATWSISIWDKQFLPFPTLEVQQRIADYLDTKCGEIDSLIALQERMIEKLKSYKQSVITEAVTKGLDPNAKLVPSGIDWIGEIPTGWKVTVLRRFAHIILGKMLQPSPKFKEDSLEQYICAKDVHFEGIDTSDLKKMYFNQAEKELYQIQKGDMLVVEGGAGAAGSCVLRNDLPDTYIQNSIMIVRPKQGIDIRYIQYYEFSLVKKGYVDYVCNKATIPHFTKDKLSSMPIPLPPLSEQQAIASYLDEKCADIDRLIALKRQKIESLKDYKKSVIYEAVTGKTIL